MISFFRTLGICWLLTTGAFAQSLTSNLNLLQFSPTTELGTDSLSFVLTNASSQTLQCRIITFDIYEHRPFWTPDSVFALPASGQRTIKVYFKPKHNILNNSELIVRHNGTGGSLRIDLKGQGKFSNQYYNTTENLEGNDLRSALNTRLATPYTQLGYNTGRIHMFHTIDNWKVNGRQPNHTEAYKNECVYTGRTISYNSALSTGTLNNAPYSMNTEHTWPQSQGAENEPMRSDLHHLYPSDASINSSRGNKPFGWVPNPTLTYTGGNKANTSTFEPRDAHKGAVAASILYFATRYYNNNSVNLGFLSAGQETDLREWIKLFPPDSVLKKRNNDIQSFQQNRNPYIDYPQFLDRMTQVRGIAAVPATNAIFLADTVVAFGAVASGAQSVYRVVIVNNGTQSLSLTNINATGTGLTVATGTSMTIGRGEAGIIELQYTGSGQAFNGQLQFNTNVPGQTTISIPVTALAGGAGGVSITGFSLLSPLSGLELVLAGDTATQITFRWQSAQVSTGQPAQYQFQMRNAASQQNITTIAGISDTTLGISFGQFDQLLRASGHQTGDLVNTQWFITASESGGMQRVSNENRNLGLRLGLLASLENIQNAIKVYPNPVQNELNIEGIQGKIEQIELLNMLGQSQPVAVQEATAPLQLQIGALPVGKYLLRIKTDKGLFSTSIVKQ